MKQEVQVTLTLSVDVTEDKKEISAFIKDLINSHTHLSTTHNRMVYDINDAFLIKEEAEIYQTEKEDFPNGKECFLETYFLIVEFITDKKKDLELLPECEIKTIYDSQGTGGLWQLAQNWTEEFEKRHKGYEWGVDAESLDYYDTIDAFCEEKNNEQLRLPVVEEE